MATIACNERLDAAIHSQRTYLVTAGAHSGCSDLVGRSDAEPAEPQNLDLGLRMLPGPPTNMLKMLMI